MWRAFLLLFLFSSCTSIEYRARGLIPIYFSHHDQHVNVEKVSGKSEFYLWGLYPPQHVVDIDNVLAMAGIRSAANIRIEEYQTFSNLVWGILSFGMYWAVDYEIHCLSKEIK